MDPNQQDVRHSATQAFMESLEQLQETLKPVSPPPVRSQSPQGSKGNPIPPPNADFESFDPHLFEQAAADIEEFFRQMGTEE